MQVFTLMPASSQPGAELPGWFATTYWSVVLQAGEGDSPAAHQALSQLCQTYSGVDRSCQHYAPGDQITALLGTWKLEVTTLPTWWPDGTQVVFRIGSDQNLDGSISKLTLGTGELTLFRYKGDHLDW